MTTRSFATLGARLNPRLWAGPTFFVTCVLLGLAAIGGLCERGKRREACLGAAVLGAGFLMLAFARSADDPLPILPTFQILEDIHPWLPIISSERPGDLESTAAANARIRRALQQPIPMNFAPETHLDNVLGYVQKTTASRHHPGVPIYVNQQELSKAHSWKTSNSVEVHDVPLRTSLQGCLDQFDLAYVVKDGFVEITSRESAAHLLRSTVADPYQIVGHCVLALIAAGLGGLAAPLVCNLTRKRDRPRIAPSAG
jgi:hypothetical protein